MLAALLVNLPGEAEAAGTVDLLPWDVWRKIRDKLKSNNVKTREVLDRESIRGTLDELYSAVRQSEPTRKRAERLVQPFTHRTRTREPVPQIVAAIDWQRFLLDLGRLDELLRLWRILRDEEAVTILLLSD